MVHYFIHALSRFNPLHYSRYPYLGTAYEYDPYFYSFDSVSDTVILSLLL